MVEQGYFDSSTIILLHRDERLVVDLDYFKYKVPMFQYFELGSLYSKFVARYRADIIIEEIANGKPYRLYIPHHDCVMFHRLKEHSLCREYTYLEEGTATLLEKSDINYNNRAKFVSLSLEKYLGLKDDYRFFNVIHPKFAGHVGFFKPIGLFGKKYALIDKPSFSKDGLMNSDVLLFLDKTIIGYSTDTATELDRVLSYVINSCNFNRLFIKPHPKTCDEDLNSLYGLVKKASIGYAISINVLEPELTFNKIFDGTVYSCVFTGFSSSVIELILYTDKIKVYLSEHELPKYYANYWVDFKNFILEFFKRNNVGAFSLQLDII